MGLNDVTSAERIHIGFFGMRNAGKSSLVNAITGQNLSVVSEVPGTTTDPVRKSMELLPLGPVVIIDTPGLDDEGILGKLRIQKTNEVLATIDIAILVSSAVTGLQKEEEALLNIIKEKQLPYVIVYNKCDLDGTLQNLEPHGLPVSARTGMNITRLKEQIAGLRKPELTRPLTADLVTTGDLVILVIPIDSGAPKGRLILPQQQTIRDLLDNGAIPCATTPEQLPQILASLSVKPRLVITDSQVFGKVSAMLPADILLTSFSILFARYKGNLELLVQGAKTLDTLSDGDTILISEGCTHHRQCGDIGTVKLPAMLQKYTGKNLNFSFTSGKEFPDSLDNYALVLHCGGCMLTEQEMRYRLNQVAKNAIAITNYGMAMAHMNGILSRSLAPFSMNF